MSNPQTLGYQKEKRKKYVDAAIYSNNISIIIMNYILKKIFLAATNIFKFLYTQFGSDQQTPIAIKQKGK